MELDKRIKEGKRPLTCFDIEEAKKYVGKDCYFSSKFENFENLSKVPHATLHNVDDSHTPFQCYGEDGVLCYDCFILPCEWVKEKKEPKYRPLSYKEFWRLFDFGDGVCFRRKGQDTVEFSMFLGYELNSDGNRDEIPGEGRVNLGGNRYTLAELFENYEMELDDEWQPFGVMEDD